MKKLNKFEMAAVKRTALSTKKLRSKAEKIAAEIVELGKELTEVRAQIEVWEKPVKEMTGGYSSEEVVSMNGEIPDTVDMMKAESPVSDTEAMNIPAPTINDEPFNN